MRPITLLLLAAALSACDAPGPTAHEDVLFETSGWPSTVRETWGRENGGAVVIRDADALRRFRPGVSPTAPEVDFSESVVIAVGTGDGSPYCSRTVGSTAVVEGRVTIILAEGPGWPEEGVCPALYHPRTFVVTVDADVVGDGPVTVLLSPTWPGGPDSRLAEPFE